MKMRRVPLPEGQAELLEMIAKGHPLKDTLTRLTQLIELQSDGLYCSIMLLDEDGERMHPAAGSRMPASYMNALDGLVIGPDVGSCGTAMFKKETVVVTDVLRDPLWAPYKKLIEPYGFRACWSTPILLDRETVLGSFAMYYREVASPGPVELELMAVATHIAGIAIERKRNEDALRRYQHELQGLVQARTAELNAEKEKAVATAEALRQSNQDLARAFDMLNATQEELVQSKKLAALGSLVAGIAHKLNTPIGNCTMASSSLLDHTTRLRRSLEENNGLKRSDLVHFLENTSTAQQIMERNLDIAAQLVSTFKEIAALPDSSGRRSFRLDEWLRQLVEAFRPRLEEHGVTLEQAIPADVQCESYPNSLGEILNSLLDNALIHAFEGRAGGTITIRARSKPNGIIDIEVQDNGLGMDSDVLGRIFDPFFTTKLGGGSLGLGLNIVHNVVTSILGGQVHIQSKPQEGTVVTVSLPRIAPAREA